MKQWQRNSLWIGGGLTLFVAAFVGFALSLGGHWSDWAPKPAGHGAATEALDAQATAPAREPVRPIEARTASLGVLDLFQIESPYSADELRALADELRDKKRELDQRLDNLGERERRAAEREQRVAEQFAELTKLREGLDTWQSEVAARALELGSKERDSERRDGESWSRLAQLLEDGDAAELAEKLAQYTPEDAARVLHALKPARAKELLDALDAERWKAFAEAYRKLATDGG